MEVINTLAKYSLVIATACLFSSYALAQEESELEDFSDNGVTVVQQVTAEAEVPLNEFIHPDIATEYCGNGKFSKSDVIAFINKVRVSGIQCESRYYPPVKKVEWSDELEEAAKRHSKDMSIHGFLDHKGSDGSLPEVRAEDAGYKRLRVITENIASGTRSMASTLEALIVSEYHCTNLMNKKVKNMGMACAYNPSSGQALFWTQVFAAK